MKNNIKTLHKKLADKETHFQIFSLPSKQDRLTPILKLLKKNYAFAYCLEIKAIKEVSPQTRFVTTQQWWLSSLAHQLSHSVDCCALQL